MRSPRLGLIPKRRHTYHSKSSRLVFIRRPAIGNKDLIAVSNIKFSNSTTSLLTHRSLKCLLLGSRLISELWVPLQPLIIPIMMSGVDIRGSIPSHGAPALCNCHGPWHVSLHGIVILSSGVSSYIAYPSAILHLAECQEAQHLDLYSYTIPAPAPCCHQRGFPQQKLHSLCRCLPPNKLRDEFRASELECNVIAVNVRIAQPDHVSSPLVSPSP
ncbi:hypothetical protein BJ170DRAFT_293527 [Xylariales sp. AK1849]|nr:hypothetical protein BJ170DRAFT_293527 [Xylariales sp. AK1849]